MTHANVLMVLIGVGHVVFSRYLVWIFVDACLRWMRNEDASKSTNVRMMSLERVTVAGRLMIISAPLVVLIFLGSALL